MAQVKRIIISIPDNLLEEADDMAQSEQINRSEFIREAMRLYIAERKKQILREQLRLGYLEMAKINLALALEACYLDNEMTLFEPRTKG
ncbi:MAG: ribbon-helix-helix protein, CopG family [Clostridia bacterium]|nr:ribbon-helix-helix protein, CopG family [Clostridia bacterium]